MTRKMRDEFDDIYEDDEEEEDFFSPTSWERDPFETDEEYLERIEDLDSYFENL